MGIIMTKFKIIREGDKKPSLEQMQAFVGGRIEIVRLSDGDHLVINEEGLLDGLPINFEATAVWYCDLGYEVVEEHGLPPLVGDIMLVHGGSD